MPRRIPAGLPALASVFDATPWAETDVCARKGGGPTLTLPAYGPGEAAGDGHYLDAGHFLHGFGVETPRDLSSLLTFGWAALGGAGAIDVRIDATDRLSIDHGGAEDLILQAAPGNSRFGLAAAGITVPAGTTVVLPGEWIRGTLDPDEYLILERDGFVATLEITLYRVQDLRIALRKRGVPGDLDEAAVTLQSLDVLTWWGIEQGHVWWATTAATTGMDWLSTSFRDRLGFTGDEAVTTWGSGGRDVRGQIATHPLPGYVELSRPLRRQRPRVQTIGDTKRTADGAWSSSEIGHYRGWTIEGFIDGLQDAGDDLHRHWLDLRAEYAPPGWPLTLYQDVGDSRRALDPRRVNADQPAYDWLYTSEHGGYRGRILCRVSPESSRDDEIESDGPFRRRHPFTLVLDEREDGV